MNAEDAPPTTAFRAELELGGKTAAGIEVPPDALAALGAGRRPAVRVTIGSYSYRTTIGVMGGRSLIPVSAEHRRAAGIEAGDSLDVALTLDTEVRTVTVPDDLAAVLADEPETKAFFQGLTPSQQRWHVGNIEGAKTAETRARRVDKSLDLLRRRQAR